MRPQCLTLAATAAHIYARREAHPASRALLVGISGIDGAGKGWVANQLASRLNAAGVATVVLNVDGWLNLPAERFSELGPAEHFYDHALRLEPFVRDLLQPLQRTRSVDLTADFAEETAASFRRHRYQVTDTSVILAEGIFLFKRRYRPVYDLALWVDCTFETAMARALARGQEGLEPAATRQAYERIYFPAQRLHFVKDAPAQSADLCLINDPVLLD